MWFGLEDEFRVLEVERVDATSGSVIIEQLAREGPCPACGVFTGRVKDRPVLSLKGLPASGNGWSCRGGNAGWSAVKCCVRNRRSPSLGGGAAAGRVTEQLRQAVATAIASSNRAVSDVAAEYGCRGRPRTGAGRGRSEVVGAGADHAVGDR